VSLVERLRRECPWDREQTFSSLGTYLLEEAHETLEALSAEDAGRLRSELGDLLFQIFFLCRLAAERGWFDVHDVSRSIERKMIDRHPHVFGGERAASAGAVQASWEKRKRLAPDTPEDPLAGIPRALPALAAALRMSARAADLGFDWERETDILVKLEEEVAELRDAEGHRDPRALEEETGDVLFTVVNYARRRGVDPEKALREANGKFRRRFLSVAQKARRTGHDISECSTPELDRFWNEVKAEEKSTPREALRPGPG